MRKCHPNPSSQTYFISNAIIINYHITKSNNSMLA